MNFISEYYFGQSGGNKGLSMGPGLIALNKAINGVQKKMMYGVASSPKVKENPSITDLVKCC